MTTNSKVVLVTGSNGFIGTHLIETLAKDRELKPVAGVRSADKSPSSAAECRTLGDLEDYETLSPSTLEGIHVVVHTAARAHILNERLPNTNPFQKANVDATLALARAAAKAGVTRFVLVSSIGVNGSFSVRPFTAEMDVAPDEPYAQSKLEAEKGLLNIRDETGMELVIIRPPLVYGPNAPGNFGVLSRIMRVGIPLPLRGVNNARSFVSVWNLVDLIKICVKHPDARNSTFLVRDGEDVSTPELLRKIAVAQGRSPRLFWVPQGLLKVTASLTGKRKVYDRLFDSLQVDDRATRHALSWEPPLSMDEGIKRTFSYD